MLMNNRIQFDDKMMSSNLFGKFIEIATAIEEIKAEKNE